MTFLKLKNEGAFDLDRWENENRDRIAQHFRQVEYPPDDYDWQPVMVNASTMLAKKLSYKANDRHANNWITDLPTLVRGAEETWEFFGYPDFKEVVERPLNNGISEASKMVIASYSVSSLDPYITGNSRLYPKTVFGVALVDILVFPSRNNKIKTELDRYGTPTPLMRWFVIMYPRGKWLAQVLGTQVMMSAAFTSWQRARLGIREELSLWADNYRPR